jgi:predicted acylesterase/phospholipase RssA
VALATTPVQAQLPGTSIWRVADTSRVVNLAYASSGGISTGAYQAGLNWMLVELMRFLRANPETRFRYHLPSYRITALSGSSAGNINALLSALQWCDAGPVQPAEQSVYWDIWMQIGMPQLLPDSKNDDSLELGLFDRTFFNTVLKARLERELAKAALPDCFIPVGATASKLLPTRLPLNRYISANVQRYVAAYEVTSARGGDSPTWHFVLREPHALIQQDTALGKQITLASGDRGAAYAEFNQLFELVKASSSIAYVFAPVRLSYCDAGLAAQAGSCNAATAPASEVTQSRFVDGGAIDNAPLFLALRLLTLSDSLAPDADQRGRHHPSGAIFVGYDARRRPDSSVSGPAGPGSKRGARRDAARLCKSAGDPEHCGGLGALVQFMGGLMSSSSQYELQWLIRARAQDPALRIQDIDVTTRHAEIVGEKLSNFAAFFGRPFRELDFHVGVYDALHYAASAVLCLPEHRQASDSSGVDACIVNKVRTMVDLLPLSCASALTLDLLLREEYGIESSAAEREQHLLESGACSHRTREDSLRAAAYRSVATALHAANMVRPRDCAGRPTVVGMLCASGIAPLFERLKADTGFVRYAEAKEGECRKSIRAAATPFDRRRAQAECFVDREFLSAVRDSRRTFVRQIRRVLERMQSLEEEIEVQEAGVSARVHYDAGTQFLNYAARSALLAEDEGWISFPTVVPQRDRPWRLLTGLLLPQEVELQLLGKAWSVGWRPLAYRWSAGGVAELQVGRTQDAFVSNSTLTGKSKRLSHFTGEALVGFRPRARGRVLLSGFEGGVRYWFPVPADRSTAFSSASTSPMARLDMLWDRFSLTATTTPEYAAAHDRRKLRLSVAANDVGGMLYWVLRSRTFR